VQPDVRLVARCTLVEGLFPGGGSAHRKGGCRFPDDEQVYCFLDRGGRVRDRKKLHLQLVGETRSHRAGRSLGVPDHRLVDDKRSHGLLPEEWTTWSADQLTSTVLHAPGAA
jgi:hypothetical protein